MHVIVCGGRDYANREAVWAALDRLLARGLVRVSHGASRGADALADEWARARGVERVLFPADWKGRGKRAGPERNQRMLDACLTQGLTGVVAFPGDRGTADMVARATAAGVRVWRPVAV